MRRRRARPRVSRRSRTERATGTGGRTRISWLVLCCCLVFVLTCGVGPDRLAGELSTVPGRVTSGLTVDFRESRSRPARDSLLSISRTGSLAPFWRWRGLWMASAVFESSRACVRASSRGDSPRDARGVCLSPLRVTALTGQPDGARSVSERPALCLRDPVANPRQCTTLAAFRRAAQASRSEHSEPRRA